MRSRPSAMPASYWFVFSGDGRVRFASEGDPLRPSRRYDVDDLAIARAFGSAIPAEFADLIDIGLAIYVSDRLARRCPAHADLYHPHWTRRIKVRLPVRDPDRWSEPALLERLRRLLWLLTDDLWEFDFVARLAQPRPSETIAALPFSKPVEPVTVALFSGGLDSFGGACRELLNCPTGTLVLFSGRTNSRVGAAQALLARELRRKSRRELRRVVVRFELKGGNGQYDEDERSQRSRGFIFAVLGAVAGLLAGAYELLVYEPGIGAINLPYTEAQLGAQSTRATDPRTLVGLSEFVTLGTGRPFAIRLPLALATKAELCTSIVELGLGNLVSETLSCDSVPLRVANHTHCGLCTSCLLRRQALDAVGLGALDRRAGTYIKDVLASPTALRFEDLHQLRAMDYQAAQLAWAAKQAQPWRELTRMYPQLVEIALAVARTAWETGPIEAQLVNLYRRYCDEWARFRAQFPGALAA